ncbi:MAG: diacylglycerol kinase family lipid kinase [Cytophagaceae bacterium]|jgi:YegS/Rv2252/BmrU family lipid kinase|nr:diacylglycerol kinase family lipid kinase [Cytophagaceae bacterium]
MKKAVFIINPVSGIGRQKEVEKIIRNEMSPNHWETHVIYTKQKGHAHEIATDAIDKCDMVVAVGGDGTVNEVGSALIGTATTLGILPTGSGNGLARYLGMPFKIPKALQVLNYFERRKIDTVKFNDYFSLNVAGVGFDAHISHKFAKRKKRGPIAYGQLITKEFAQYRSESYMVTINGETQEWDAFLISFANSSQWGNNVQIAPFAEIDDGLIDVCFIRDFPKYTAPALLINLLDQSIDRNRYDVIVKAKNVTIEREIPMLGHVDGEPVLLGNSVNVEILPLSLNVAIPPKHLRQAQNLLTPIIELLPEF